MSNSMGLFSTVIKGNRRDSLMSLRDFLAAQIEQCPPEKVAPLAKTLADVLRELDSFPALEESDLDELARQRAARRTAAAGANPARVRESGNRGGGDPASG